MSNRTKIKKQPPISTTPPPLQQRKSFQPSPTLLGAIIFLTLGTVILAKSVYLFLPAGLILMAVIVWFDRSFKTKRRVSVLLPLVLLAIVLAVRTYGTLPK